MVIVSAMADTVSDIRRHLGVKARLMDIAKQSRRQRYEEGPWTCPAYGTEKEVTVHQPVSIL
jgi:hypothetical protein